MVPPSGYSNAIIMSDKKEMPIAEKIKSSMKLKEALEGAAKNHRQHATSAELVYLIIDALNDERDENLSQLMKENPISAKLREVAELYEGLAKIEEERIDKLLAGIDAVEQAREVTG